MLLKFKMEVILLTLLLGFSGVHTDRFYPISTPLRVKRFTTSDSQTQNPRFRSLLIDEGDGAAYVGAQSNLFKLRLSSGKSVLGESYRSRLRSIAQDKPAFKDKSTDGEWWTGVDFKNSDFKNYQPIKDFLTEFNIDPDEYTYRSLNLHHRLEDYLRDVPFGSVYDLEGNAVLEIAEQYSTIYQSAKLTFREHCVRQAEALALYYGRDLQMNVSDFSVLCDTHIRGMTLMGDNKLFSIKTGLFGTMPVSATGTNRYDDWLRYQVKIQPFLNCLYDSQSSTCHPTFSSQPPFDPTSYDGIVTNDPSKSRPNKLPNRNSYLMPSPENHLGKLRHCDNAPAPNRLILDTSELNIVNDQVLVGDMEKESCAEGSLAQLFLGGYHADQKTLTLHSSSGNGASANMQAVYILTEIGQEKQLDLMRHFLNLPEIYPTSSSASLAMVRLLINSATGDVDPKSIVISNPFKYTWVTSPLNRFGRLDKSGSQEQVAYTPKPVALYEGSDYVYFFFREADWENTPIPSYNVRRYHHNLNSYTRALYFPWEKSFINRKYTKQEEAPSNTFEELYAPQYMGWQHANDNLKVTGRVARVSKNDAGLPMGLQDASLFDLDHRLSLTAFQTFVKSRLTCKVPVAGVPFVWRLRRDATPIGNNSEDCVTEVRKPKNLYSKDIHYRSVSRNEYVSIQEELPPTSGNALPSFPVLKYYYLAHCKGYRWEYVPKPRTSSALYTEYTELRDVFRIGDIFYGVFSTPLANEQLYTDSTRPDSSIKPVLGSALCSFTFSDIKATFEGPFKKRDKSTGSYRPYGEKDTAGIDPSPYSKHRDSVAEAKASTIKNMTIDFLDPTQPYSEEIRNIDLRRYSSRLNFFEEDVYGSRTMWDDVKTKPLLTESGIVFESVVAENVGETTMLYVATNVGTIYKIANTVLPKSRCRMTDKTSYLNWLNKTESMSSIWDNKFYAYMNRTVDKVTFAASFKSDLTIEKDIKFPDDMLVTSDWDCTPSVKSTILAILKPFGSVNTKIWDMKLANVDGKSSLVLSTDKEVLQIPTIQCSIYTHCSACNKDMQCAWSNTGKKCGVFGGSAINRNKTCSCQMEQVVANVKDDVVLAGLNQPVDLSLLQWYVNDTKVEYRSSRIMLSHDTSLILFNVIPSNAGRYELRNIETDECLASYQLSLSECDDEECRYQIKYQEWCNRYDTFEKETKQWEADYEGYGYCSNLN